MTFLDNRAGFYDFWDFNLKTPVLKNVAQPFLS